MGAVGEDLATRVSRSPTGYSSPKPLKWRYRRRSSAGNCSMASLSADLIRFDDVRAAADTLR